MKNTQELQEITFYYSMQSQSLESLLWLHMFSSHISIFMASLMWPFNLGNWGDREFTDSADSVSYSQTPPQLTFSLLNLNLSFIFLFLSIVAKNIIYPQMCIVCFFSYIFFFSTLNIPSFFSSLHFRLSTLQPPS